MVENGVADALTSESLAELAGICPVFRVRPGLTGADSGDQPPKRRTPRV
jgi:hypothetical protein